MANLLHPADQLGLFDQSAGSSNNHQNNLGPLAYRVRPQTFSEFKGQENALEKLNINNLKKFPSLIIWGPPGTGKTTLAYLLSHQSERELYKFNAVLGGVADLKKLISRALEMKAYSKNIPIIFIDEIHRFNKSQQDALLPYVESGAFTLIGATTENPRVSVNPALLSRLQIIFLEKLSPENIFSIIKRASINEKMPFDDQIIELIADNSDGDARKSLNILEELFRQSKINKLTLEQTKHLILTNARSYDRNGNRHYDVISAFIKSLRGSDPDAALTWLAVMIDGGEDPLFIARRLIIFASEDIGNANPQALSLATSALLAIQNIGMPEGRIILAQAVTYLASSEKSNASYQAINKAIGWVQGQNTLEVPDHLRNFPPPNSPSYLYPHNYPDHFVDQKYTLSNTPIFYRPNNMGEEKAIRNKLKKLRPERY